MSSVTDQLLSNTNNMSKSKGSKYERDLRDWFFSVGGSAIRIGSSGAGTSDPLPDVFGTAGIDEFGSPKLYACELKFTSGDYATFKTDEIIELYRFSTPWNATPVLVSRFSQDTSFYGIAFKDPDDFDSLTQNKSISFNREHRGNIDTMVNIVNS